jgi:hypothetical protein
MTKEDELTAGLQAELARVNARIGCVNHDCDKCKAAQPAPVKTYHDGKPWPVAPKPWVGLTDEEIDEHLSEDAQGDCEMHEYARAIEAKLREKNGGAA